MDRSSFRAPLDLQVQFFKRQKEYLLIVRDQHRIRVTYSQNLKVASLYNRIGDKLNEAAEHYDEWLKAFNGQILDDASDNGVVLSQCFSPF